MNREFLHMQMLAGLITEGEYKSSISELNVDEVKTVQKGQKIQYAIGKQPPKEAYMVEYSDHSYNQDWCVVSDSEDLKDSYLISKRWIKKQ